MLAFEPGKAIVLEHLHDGLHRLAGDLAAAARRVTPKASTMYGVDPRPMPNSTRPLLSTSSVATRSATKKG